MRKPQRAYRDSLFRDIFNNVDRLPEIYEALLGIKTTASDITLATINETLFSGIKNDVGFIVGSQHVLLTEHQSTINANMPLRMLMYLAEIYRRYVDADAVYRKRLIPLPAPKFYVFYNGIEKMPDTCGRFIFLMLSREERLIWNLQLRSLTSTISRGAPSWRNATH